MAKYTYTINDQSFRSATKAISHLQKSIKAEVKISKVRCNNEPILISELEDIAKLEAAEKAHNKRQGL